ncbi:MAG: hypothetical protein ACN6OP_10940 [Pseudomonadales bacterium]
MKDLALWSAAMSFAILAIIRLLIARKPGHLVAAGVMIFLAFVINLSR